MLKTPVLGASLLELIVTEYTQPLLTLLPKRLQRAAALEGPLEIS